MSNLAFISHSSKDQSEVERLCDSLLERNIDVWLPGTHIKPGDDIASRINEAIHSSDAVLVIISPASTQSQWVSAEISIALAQQRKIGKPLIIPVIIKKTQIDDLPYFLRNLSWIDLTNDQLFDANIDRIVDAIRQSGNRTFDQEYSDQVRLMQLRGEKYLLEVEKATRTLQSRRASFRILLILITVGATTMLSLLSLVFFQKVAISSILSFLVPFVSGIVSGIIVARSLPIGIKLLRRGTDVER